MIFSPRMRPGTRATRVNLQGRVSSILQLENGRQFSGQLYRLSVTGGLLELETYLEERSRVGMAIPIGAMVIRPDAEMLFPSWGVNGYLQPFRFIRLWAQERQTIETEIEAMLKQRLARSTPGVGLRPRRF